MNVLEAIFISAYKQIRYAIDPNERIKDHEIYKSLGMTVDQNFRDTEKFLYTWRMISDRITSAWNELFCEANEGNACPNPTVIDFESGKSIKLWDVLSKSRPTVLNFGSCTWPPFMVNLERIKELHASFAQVADFVTVYIEEAHPFDRGDFPSLKYRIDNHKCLKDRIEAAKVLEAENLPGSLFVDTMKNEARWMFSALPDRLYIVSELKVAFQGGIGPFHYEIEPVEKWLKNYAQKQL